MISKPNFELLLREGRSFEEYFRSRENNDALKAEEDILPKTTTRRMRPYCKRMKIRRKRMIRRKTFKFLIQHEKLNVIMDKILWADDEIDLLKPHIMFLKAKGYDVATASNGRDALDMLMHERFDLILLDENMPGLSGLETLSKINQTHPEIPVIMITKSEEENLMNQAIGNQIADYLIKPVNPNQILLSIKKNLHSNELVAAQTSSDYQQEFQKISSLINMADSIENWMEVYRQLVYWELKLADTDTALAQLLLMQKRDANSNFCKFVKREYQGWLQSDDHPMMSHEIFKRKVFPLLDKGEKVCLFIIDNFRLDQWKVVMPLLSEWFDMDEELYSSILPTSTQYARNAIFAGLMPLKIKEMYPTCGWRRMRMKDSISMRANLYAPSLKDSAGRRNSPTISSTTHLPERNSSTRLTR